MNYSLGIILPTNSPEQFFEICAPSIKNLSPMSGRVEFLVNFQPPFNSSKKNLARKIITDAGLGFRHISTEQKRPPSLFRLRHDCAMLWRDADYYMFADDNLQFSGKGTSKYPRPSWKRYEECIEYMMHFKNCGGVMCEGSLGGDVQKFEIRPTTSGLISTTRGLFFKNVHRGQIFPENSLSLDGGLEDNVAAFYLMEQGFFIAKQFNNPTLHKNKSRLHDPTAPNHPTNYELIYNNAQKFIRERYDAESWTLDSRKVPRRLWEMYRAAGGDDKAFGDLCRSCGNEIPSPKYWRNYK